LAILAGKKMEKIMQIQGRMSTTTKIAKKLRDFLKKKILMM